MANINEILARAAALRDETALNSISPERAGGIMYDTLLALNELWLQQGSALVISKIYASVAAMEADSAPVSDLTGQPLRPGQIVVIASSDSDNGSVYRYNGIVNDASSWTLVGAIGNLDPVDSLDSDSTTLPLAAHQGKVLKEDIDQITEETNLSLDIFGNYWISYASPHAATNSPFFTLYACQVAPKCLLDFENITPASDTVPAVIAFYKKEITSSADSANYWIGGIQNTVGKTSYSAVEVPAEAKYCYISVRSTSVTPTVKMTSPRGVAQLSKDIVALNKTVNEIQKEVLVFEGTGTSVLGGIIASSLDAGFYRVDISVGESDVIDTADCYVAVSLGGFYSPLKYAFKPGIPVFLPIYTDGIVNGAMRINYKFTSESHSITAKVYKINSGIIDETKSFPLLSYSPSLEKSLSLEWEQGYWNDLSGKTKVAYWCTTNIQFNRGRKIRLTFSSDYVVITRGFIYNAETNQFAGSNGLSSPVSGTIYDTSNWMVWAIQIRRSNYQNLTPEQAAAAITIEDLGGELYAKDITANDIEMFLAGNPDVEQQIQRLQTDTQRNFRLGTIELGGLYHHIGVESNNSTIPSQSLFDIIFAKKLGFKFIEANLQTCSDGIIVTKHGSAGALGAGLLFAEGSGFNENTLFSQISSNDLRQYVKYNSTLQKYQVPIPTLEEFCAECARQDMIPYLRGINAAGLAIARKYLPDEKMVIEGISRGDFRGMMTVYGSATNKEDILALCKTYGAPFFYGWSRFASESDENISAVITELHKNGYLIAGSYIGSQKYEHLRGLGIDFIASTNLDIPLFFEGRDLNVRGCNDNNLTLTGATYDTTSKTIQMEPGDEISVSSSSLGGNLSKICICLSFSGKIDIVFGPSSNLNPSVDFVDFSSAGEKEITIAHLCGSASPAFTITAKEATTIKDINVYGSVVIER